MTRRPQRGNVFDQADEVLGFPLSRLCFQGPADELEDTINAQPAILTASIAALEALKGATCRGWAKGRSGPWWPGIRWVSSQRSLLQV
jgi:malonyl CoA-acyl carrier protein transacylase